MLKVSVLSAQFYCEPETALKNKVYFLEKRTTKKVKSAPPPGRPSLTSWDIVFWTFHDLGAFGVHGTLK